MLCLIARKSFAVDLVNGRKVFQANCAACHKNGGNVVVENKTLKKEVLLKYGQSSLEAIQKHVANGRKKIPAFKNFLSPKQIEDVSVYILDQAEKGWRTGRVT